MQTTQTFPSLPDVALPTKHLPEEEGERQLQQEQLGSIQGGKKTNKPREKSREELLDRMQKRYYTGKGLACDRNPFCNLKNLAHYCYCCSLCGLLHFSAIGM